MTETTGKPIDVAVLYLSRGADPDWRAATERFVSSYRNQPSGCDHRLYLIRKGFQSKAALKSAASVFGDLKPQIIDVDDEGFDLGAYRQACVNLTERYVCFFNTNSEILGSNWLHKLLVHLKRPAIGMVSASGSFESMGQGDPDYPEFPNIHLRSNAFMIDRLLFLDLIGTQPFVVKEDAYRAESGLNSLSRQVRRRGLETLLVGRNGRGYAPQWWPVSDTFRQGAQSNLLIGDNQTRWFAALPPDQKANVAKLSWGGYPAAALSPLWLKRLVKDLGSQ